VSDKGGRKGASAREHKAVDKERVSKRVVARSLEGKLGCEAWEAFIPRRVRARTIVIVRDEQQRETTAHGSKTARRMGRVGKDIAIVKAAERIVQERLVLLSTTRLPVIQVIPMMPSDTGIRNQRSKVQSRARGVPQMGIRGGATQ
jgi:hypothetical protein